MNQLKSSSTEGQVPAKDSALALKKVLRISKTLFSGHIAGIIFVLIFALQAGSWQIYVMTGVLIVTGVIYFAALQMMRRGRLESGGWMLLAAVMVGILMGPFLIAGSGVILGIVSVIVAYLIASQMLPVKYIRPILYGSTVIGTLVALTDFLDLAYRLNVPALQAFTPILVTVILLTAAFFVLREAWSRSLSISRKLLLAFGLLGVLALVVGVVANFGLNRVQNSFQAALSGGEAMKLTSLHLERDLLTARRHEKDFLLRWTEQGFDTAYENYVVPNQASVAEIREHIDELVAFAPLVEQDQSTAARTEYEADLAVLSESIDLYGQNFQTTVQLIQEKGFQDEGLEGQFREDVHDIEDRIYDRKGLEPLVITMLSIRRHEKDYLLRGDQTYIDQTHASVAELKRQISASEILSSVEKSEMLSLADDYVLSFDALVEKSAQMDIAIEAFRDAAHTMEPLTEKIVAKGNELSAFDVAAAETTSSQTLLYSSVTLVVALLFAAFLSVGLSKQISNPLRSLTSTAQEISTGNFSLQVQVTTGDEIGTLAQSFNIMTERLGQAFEDVRRRAAELATVAEVSTATSTILESKRLLQEVVDLTKERFNLYHSHIYLLDEHGQNLVLAAGAGEPGRVMVAEKRFIPLDREQSLVARAAREQKGVTVNDVTQAPDFLPNPLLPDTRSELAVPMIVAGIVIGVFDIQSEQVGRFGESDVAIQTTLAAQLATSIQNVRSFEQSKKQADFEAMVNLIGQRIQRTTSIEETLQTAIRELGTAVGASRVKANISASKDGNNN